ncbi:Uncharacterised protein [Lysinibacillus sphaericus]|nr:Uncharacterised protein [Lysinibacillus sphaericus]
MPSYKSLEVGEKIPASTPLEKGAIIAESILLVIVILEMGRLSKSKKDG